MVASILLVAVVYLSPVTAAADARHVVARGQTMSAIARQHRVSIKNLAAANGLKRDQSLRIGQVLRVPSRGVIYVYPGQTLSAIAKVNDVTIRDLTRRNRLDPSAPLRAGQRLVLPGFSAKATRSHVARSRSGHARSRGGTPPGTVQFYRPAFHESLRVRLLDHQGRVRPAARNLLSKLLRDRKSKRARLPHARLLEVLAEISEHFDGRRVVVVSGYRRPGGHTSKKSRHTKGHAIDIRVDGVDNETLRDYCRSIPDLGVGYYPRSTFVHVDVRERPAYWVDWSRPGEAPQYLRPGTQPEDKTPAQATTQADATRETSDAELP